MKMDQATGEFKAGCPIQDPPICFSSQNLLFPPHLGHCLNSVPLEDIAPEERDTYNQIHIDHFYACFSFTLKLEYTSPEMRRSFIQQFIIIFDKQFVVYCTKIECKM